MKFDEDFYKRLSCDRSDLKGDFQYSLDQRLQKTEDNWEHAYALETEQ